MSESVRFGEFVAKARGIQETLLGVRADLPWCGHPLAEHGVQLAIG